MNEELINIATQTKPENTEEWNKPDIKGQTPYTLTCMRYLE